MDRAGVPNVVWMSNQTFPWGNDCVKPYWFVVGSAHCWVVYSLIVEDKAVQFDQWLSASPFYSLSSIPVFILEGPLPAPLMMKKPRDLDRLVWEISSGWMSLSSFSSLLSIPYPLLPLFSTLLFSLYLFLSSLPVSSLIIAFRVFLHVFLVFSVVIFRLFYLNH